MKIYLKLFADTRKFHPGPDPDQPVEFPPGTTVEQVISTLGIPPRLGKIVFVNGVKAGPKLQLKDGDRLAIFPPLAGG